MSSPGSGSETIKTIAVIGAGTMGHGIAQVAAAAGFRVWLNDVDRESLARGVSSIEANLAKGIQRAKLTEDDRDRTLQLIHGTTNLKECAAADLIIEAAPEKLELKKDILRQLELASDHPFIFASNTSSLSITEIASSSKRPEAVIGMHFFNPVHIMRLVEIVVGEKTSAETVETVTTVGRKLRKEPIIVKDVPRFATSRLGVVLVQQAPRGTLQFAVKPLQAKWRKGRQPVKNDHAYERYGPFTMCEQTPDAFGRKAYFSLKRRAGANSMPTLAGTRFCRCF